MRPRPSPTCTATAVLNTTGGAVSSGGVALTYYYDSVTSILYASTDTSSVGHALATAAFSIDINPTTGAYAFDLIKQIDHAGAA